MLTVLRESLLNGSCHPLPVKRVEISELTVSMGSLGIPTILERLIQQAMVQVPGSDGEAVGGNN